MAKKKFLMEQNVQVWPITRADCVYHISGNELLSTVVDRIAANLVAEAKRAKEAEEANAAAIALLSNRTDVLESLMIEQADLTSMLDDVFK